MFTLWPPGPEERKTSIRKCTLANHFEDGFLQPAQGALADGQQFYPPPAPLDKARVHSKYIGGEQCRLVAARTGPDLHNGRSVVKRVAGHEQWEHLLLDLRSLDLQAADLVPGLARHFGIVNKSELANIRELAP